MSQQNVVVPQGYTINALIGRRYMARFIDWVVVTLIAGIVVAVLFSGVRPTTFLLPVLIILTVWVGYGALLESSPWQATVGKRMLNLRVFDSQGKRLNLMQAAIRNIVRDGPFILFALMPGTQILSMLWLAANAFVMYRSAAYQAIHDQAAGSSVVAPDPTIRLSLNSPDTPR